MRNFVIKKIIDNSTNEDLSTASEYYRYKVELIPKISAHFEVMGTTFRCIEHMPGKLVLTNEDYTLIAMEKNIACIFNNTNN